MFSISFRRLFLVASLAAASQSAPAALITIPNFSFESPEIVFASGGPIDSWTKIESSPPQVGLFDNPPANSPQMDHINDADVDGTQVAFVFAGPGIGLFQDLSATYQVGNSYSLTVGVGGGGGGMTFGTTLELRLYYRDAGNAKVNIATRAIVFDAALDAADPQPINRLFQYTANLGVVTAGNAWVGKPIGVEISGTAGSGGGYWDVDNVRLESVPEPSSALLLAGGAAGLGWRRMRRQQRL